MMIFTSGLICRDNLSIVAGYELFGEDSLSCTQGSWEETEKIPICAVNIAK